MEESMTMSRLSEEIKSFESLWPGGYYGGDPLEPTGQSTYRELGFMSALHVTYLRCIKPYVNSETIALEIGPGRGAWTRALLGCKEVWCLDALPEDHNKLYEFLGYPSNVKYLHVNDFNCGALPDNHFTYLFSFGCLCHVSFEGITQYAGNLFPKLRQSANCFWMVADYQKFNRALNNVSRLSIIENLFPGGRRYRGLKAIIRFVSAMRVGGLKSKDKDDLPLPGRWYDAGIDRTCTMLEKLGYTIIDQDTGVSHRDPVIHFAKL
jgi:hypothetical protein